MNGRGSASYPKLLALAVTVLWPVLAAGGFSDRAQIVFIALAVGLVGVTLATGETRLGAAFRSPATVALLLVGALSAASAAWAIGSAGSAIRAGLLCGAYAVVAAAAMLAAQAGGATTIAAGIAAIAIGEALLGLLAAVTHSLPEAERLAGVWRPGGTFEYQPALALLEVGALPVFASWLAGRRAWGAAAGAAGAVLAGAALALAADRLALALAVMLAVSLIALARHEQARLTAALALTVYGAFGAIVTVAMLDRTIAAGAPAPGFLQLVPTLALAVAAAGMSTLFRGRMSAPTRAPVQRSGASQHVLAIAAVLALTAAAIVAALLIAAGAPVSSAHTAGFFHGRIEEWRAALQTWWQRPLLGSGAGTYYQASLPHQTVAISRFAHDLPLEWAAELGIAGLLLGLGLYAVVARAVLLHRRAAHALQLAPLVVAFMISNLLDWTWHLPGLVALWAVSLGALTGSSPPVPEAAGEQHPRILRGGLVHRHAPAATRR